MNTYAEGACMNSDTLAQSCAKQIALGPSGAALPSSSTKYASTVQQDAASTLKNFNNDDIFAWLTLARSTRHIEPTLEQRPGERHLSPSEVLALSTLKDCPHDSLLSLLELARLHCRTPTPHASRRDLESRSGSGTVLPFLRAQPIRSAAEVTFGMDATATGPSQLVLNPWAPQLATDSFPGHDTSKFSNPTRANNADNHYWCTVCEEPKSYKDSGSWKKHEKEHETMFICELDNSAESSRAGQSQAFKCKRRDIMVKHLNMSHRITDAHQGRDLADQWRHTVKKQAWSCGFCITLFLTFQDRLRHVDIEHFRRYQSVCEWDLNKVILGLLQQPNMKTAWKTRTASLPPWLHYEKLAWDKTVAKDLRTTLEIGPSDEHHANTLADAAYSASVPIQGSQPQSGTTHANRHSDVTTQASFVSSPNAYQVTSALMPGSGSYHQPTPAVTDPTDHLVSGNASFVEASTSALAFGNTVEPAMRSFDDDTRVDHNAHLVNPYQGCTSATEPETFSNCYEASDSYGGGGAHFSTSTWYGQ